MLVVKEMWLVLNGIKICRTCYERKDCVLFVMISKRNLFFGSDRVDKSLCAWKYPVGLHGRTGVVNIAEIESSCPGLMSDVTMGQLDISINTGPRTYHVGAFDVWDHPYPKSDTDHAMIYCDQFGDLSQLDHAFFVEHSDLPIRKGTAKRLRKAATMVSDVLQDQNTEPVTSKPHLVDEKQDDS